MDESYLIPALFSFNTEHWVKVDLDGKDYAFKYIPLSLREKINITRRIEFEYPNQQECLNNKLLEFCKSMLKKAYGTDLNVDGIPSSTLMRIYQVIVNDMVSLKKQLEEFYVANKTKKLDAPKHTPSKLDTLVSMCISMKESNLTLTDLSELDEVSLFCLMIYNDEMVTRESNAYHNAKAK